MQRLNLCLLTLLTATAIGCGDKSTTPDDDNDSTAVSEAYEFVVIGATKWMTKNLNVKIKTADSAESWCYGNSEDNCAKYGRLYSWNAAKEACMSVGWRLPDTSDWKKLVSAATAEKLKTATGWGSSYNGADGFEFSTPDMHGNSYNGTDDIGFSALPGGYRISGIGKFDNIGKYGRWWATGQYSGDDAHYWFMGYDITHVGRSILSKDYGLSVRCIKSGEYNEFGSTVDVISGKGGGRYKTGATVSISADKPPSGQRFRNWTTASNGVRFADADSVTTAFTMPPNAVTVTAVFEPIPDTTTGTFTDGRDGKIYKTVTIGAQTWMAQNLNYSTESGSACYNNDPSRCHQYGRLYDWHTAATACPSGWSLPTFDDWSDLTATVGSPAGKRLKSSSGWITQGDVDGNGTDDYGFSALPGGNSLEGNNFFSGDGSYGIWWTATEYKSESAYLMRMTYDTGFVGAGFHDKSFFMVAVRCIAE